MGVAEGEAPTAVDLAFQKRAQDANAQRLASLSAASSDLRSELLEAEVLWGKELTEAKDTLLGLEHEMQKWIWYDTAALAPDTAPSVVRTIQDFVKDLRNPIHDKSKPGEPDEFAQELHRAVAAVENSLKRHLKR